MNDSGVTQQIVDIIQNSDTILVTVSTDPDVDQLSAALGLTMYLNDFGKHATAVVSGEIPPAINFLEPEKTLEPTVDSLRDFVIALDKEKADHLRYKVEGDVVKIFITPYKTVISDKDLDFTQGDYNVETVLALGVADQDHLDKALAAHGKIFHDANVITIGLESSTLGTLDWADETASSLSELAASLTSALESEEHPRSSQVASALLTGIVAATDRFSNEKTSARTMSLAGELMASGANQQLIASKLREGAKLPLQQDDGSGKKQQPRKQKEAVSSDTSSQKSRDKGLSITHAKADNASSESKESSQKKDKPAPAESPKENAKATLDAALEQAAVRESSSAQQEADKLAGDVEKTLADSAPKTPEDELSEQLAVVAPPPSPTTTALDMLASSETENESAPPVADQSNQTPTETPAVPASDVFPAANHDKTIKPHGGEYVGNDPTATPPINAVAQDKGVPSVDPFASLGAAPADSKDTLADIDKRTRGVDVQPSADAAMEAVNAVIEAAPDPEPFDPLVAIQNASPAPAEPIQNETIAPGIAAPVAPPPPPMPDFSQLPPLPPLPGGLPPVPPQSPSIPNVAPAPQQPPAAPLVDPPQAPLPPEQLGSVLPEAPSAPASGTNNPADPKQFKIPGQ